MNLESCYARAAELSALYVEHRKDWKVEHPWSAMVEVQLDGDPAPKRYLLGVGAGRPNTAGSYLVLSLGHPLQALYHEQEPGERELYEDRFDGRHVTVLYKVALERLATGELHRFKFKLPDQSLVVVRTEGGFIEESLASVRGALNKALVDILPNLTVQQFRLINASGPTPTIIRGRAGSGKTSVGLYRLVRAGLARISGAGEDAQPASDRLLALTFNKSLQSFVETSTEQMGLGHIETLTLHAWAGRAYSAAVGADQRLVPDTSPASDDAAELRAVKKHPKILGVLRAEVTRQANAMRASLPGLLAPYDPAGRWTQRYDATSGPVVVRLCAVRREVEAARAVSQSAAAATLLEHCFAVLTQVIERVTLYGKTLRRALTTSALLAEHVCDGDLERAERLAAAANAAPFVEGSIAMEDLTLALHVVQLLHGGLVRASAPDVPYFYDHVFVDEVQDLSSVDLLAVRGAVRSPGDLTLAGDAGQRITPENHFGGWRTLCEHFGLAGEAAEPAVLDAPHRSTAAIMRLGRHFLNEDAPVGERAGEMPALVVASRTDVWARVARKIGAALAQNPSAHIAVLCRKTDSVQPSLAALSAALVDVGCTTSVRAGRGDKFRFEPGVTVTNVHQVKGLEFDAVFVLDLQAASDTGAFYGDSADDRRLLYMVSTRAKSSLTLVSVGEPHVFVRSALEANLVAYDADVAPPAASVTDLF